MKSARPLMIAALLAPLAATAQVYYEVRDPSILSRSELRECMSRDESLAERRARLDRDKDAIDDEARVIARESERLARELARLPSMDAAAVAAYNADSAAHNRRVEAHNRAVADHNARAALLNGDNAAMDARCARPFMPRDRDAILHERGALR